MSIKAAVFDIDGTILPVGQSGLSARTRAALEALQAKGIPVLVATGRAQFAAEAVLGEFKPDYLVAACGNRVVQKNGRVFAQNRFTPEEMYALVDYFEDYELPLSFVFEEAYYGYVEYERLVEAYGPFSGSLCFLRDGSNQDRHLQTMPYGATGILTPAQRTAFAEKYSQLGLKFFAFHGDFCDILRSNTDKANAVGQLLQQLHIGWDEVAAFGDSGNDAEVLRAAGMPVVMANAPAEVQRLAKVLAPCCAEDGAAKIVEEYLL